MSVFSTSTIFSPTLARQALATTKDWNFVDAWLARHFAPRSPPLFERNADTLRALLALAATNESVDEENGLLFKADAHCLSEFQRQKEETDICSDLLRRLERNLTKDGKNSLEALNKTGTTLDLPSAGTELMAKRIIDLHCVMSNLEQIDSRVRILQNHMERELAIGKSFLRELDGDEYRSPPNLGKQAIEYQRKTKVIAAKLHELRERAYALGVIESSGVIRPTIQDITAEEKEFKCVQASVKSLEGQLKGFHGLPHDTDLARLELETLRLELTALKKERDGMFEGLVERESPRKQRASRR